MSRMMKAGLTMALVFGVSTGIMMHFMPEPRKSTDYLVIGTISTFAAMAALFVMAFVNTRKRKG